MSDPQSQPPTPAGWYPQADGTQRYWDGTQWTQHVGAGYVGANYLGTGNVGAGNVGTTGDGTPPTGMSTNAKVGLGCGIAAGVVVAGFLAIAGLGMMFGTTPTARPTTSPKPSSPTASPSRTAEPTTTPTPTPTPTPTATQQMFGIVGTCSPGSGNGTPYKLASVSVVRMEGGVKVTWRTSQTPPKIGRSYYSATLVANENSVYNVGFAYQDGVVQSYFVMDGTRNYEIEGSQPERNGATAIGLFPDTHMPDLKTSFQWNGTYSFEAKDSSCPDSGYVNYPPKQ